MNHLREDLQMNVPDRERMISLAAGVGLVATGAARSGPLRWLLLALGAAMVSRGVTGQCKAYKTLNVDRRHKSHGDEAAHGIKVEESIEVRCGADAMFRYWQNLEQLPRVLRHVKSVVRLDDKRSHWKVEGPWGKTIEWDADIINQEDGRMIAWQSAPGSTVRHVGSIWFEPADNDMTRVKVVFEIEPPAGALGKAIARLLGVSPDKSLREDLAAFRKFAEEKLASA